MKESRAKYVDADGLAARLELLRERSRYTVLDLAHEAGDLQDVVDELFAPGGFWSG